MWSRSKKGTNHEAILAGVDILAHPGLITEEDVQARQGEERAPGDLCARKGHSLSNGHVARLARRVGASLVYDTDSHSPSDLTTEEEARRIVLGAGLSANDFALDAEECP